MTVDIMLEASNHYHSVSASRADLSSLKLPGDFYLLTIHRAVNIDDPAGLEAIVAGINAWSGRPAVFLIHPRTRKILSERGLTFGSHVNLIDPVGYFQMIALEDACSFVVTDSGGVQKEAYFFRQTLPDPQRFHRVG